MRSLPLLVWQSVTVPITPLPDFQHLPAARRQTMNATGGCNIAPVAEGWR